MAHVRGAGAPSSETGQLPGNPEAAGREADRALPAPSGSQSWGGGVLWPLREHLALSGENADLQPRVGQWADRW